MVPQGELENRNDKGVVRRIEVYTHIVEEVEHSNGGDILDIEDNMFLLYTATQHRQEG